MKRFLALIFWILFGACFLVAGFFIYAKKSEVSILSANISPAGLAKDTQPIILMAVGDIMLERAVKYMIDKYGKGDFNFAFANIKDYLSQADILFGNLEGPISSRGIKVGSIYSFRFSPTSTLALKNAGFDILSIANNHMFDYQAVALADTMANLQKAGIDYVGAGLNEQEAFSLRIKEIQGTKVGFLGFENFSPNSWKVGDGKIGMAWVGEDFSKIKEIISQSKKQVDILAVSIHAGTEYQPLSNAFQKEFGKMAIDSGADLIIGHHPHVVEPLEKYNNGWIAYSLGNFVFDQYFSKETMEGGLLRVEIKNKKIDNVVLEKVRLNKYYQPELVVE
ncbi:MAG: CapA family protein [bacterium]